jgi:hypothetical protein
MDISSAHRAIQTFALEWAPNDPTVKIMRSNDPQLAVVGGYSITISKVSKPHITLEQWGTSYRGAIGNATFHSLSFSIDLSLHGEKIRVKQSWTGGDYTVQSPSAGELRWTSDMFWVSGMMLVDSAGLKLARLTSQSKLMGSEKKRLEVFVPCRQHFLDLIVLSGAAITQLRDVTMEAVSEAIQGGAGA